MARSEARHFCSRASLPICWKGTGEITKKRTQNRVQRYVNSHLVELYLGGNRIRPAGAVAFAESLRSGPGPAVAFGEILSHVRFSVDMD